MSPIGKSSRIVEARPRTHGGTARLRSHEVEGVVTEVGAKSAASPPATRCSPGPRDLRIETFAEYISSVLVFENMTEGHPDGVPLGHGKCCQTDRSRSKKSR